MKGIGKAYFTFKDIKKIGNLPKDALLKQYVTNTLDDTVEIHFYSNEVNDNNGIRRENILCNSKEEEKEEPPTAIDIEQIHKKYANAEVRDYVKYDLVNDINKELEYAASQGNDRAWVKVWRLRLTSREKSYISKVFGLYTVRFDILSEWSETLKKHMEYDIIKVYFY